MAYLLSLLLVPWIFWAVVTAVVVLEFVAAANESVFWPPALLIAFVVLHDFAYPASAFGMAMLAHPWLVALAVLAYLPIGAGYSIFRWRQLCVEAIRTFQRDEIDSGCMRMRYDDEVKRGMFKGEFAGYVGKKIGHWKPIASDNRDKLMSWVICWPSSLAWYVTHDFVIHLASEVYEYLLGTYNRISDKIFSGVKF